MNVLAIKFNHDQDSSTYDAINIRKNEAEPISVPEWQRGQHGISNEPAAYALSETLGNRITIHAKFKCEPGVRALEIRAIDPACVSILSELENLAYEYLYWLLPTPPAPRKNVLGTVKRKCVTFLENGESDFETFELQDVNIWNVGVSVSTTTWLWQYRLHPNSHWRSFDATNHRIYTLLKLPRDPWSQLPVTTTNIALPWTDVLEYACTWAKGAHTIDQAAVRVTQGIRRLEKTIRAVYDPSPAYYSDPNFDCAAFLNLIRGQAGHGLKLSCADFATAVSSFANILGCDLWQAGLQRGRDFSTNPIRLFGRTCWEKRTFTGHTVAWEGAATANEDIYDACLEIDGDEDPTTAPHRPLLPANLRFGEVGERGYVFRLTPPPDPGTVRPTPANNRTRRPIGPNPHERAPLVRGKLLRFVKEHYKYQEWMTVYPRGLALFSFNALPMFNGFANWNLLDQPQFVKTLNRPPVIKLIFQDKKEPDLLLRVDIDVCESEEATPLLVLQRLGQFHSPSLKRLLIPELGRIAFVEIETGAVLFTRGNLVILVRNAGPLSISLTEAAGNLDRFVLRNPEEDGEEISGMEEFSIPNRTFTVGEQVPLTYFGRPKPTGFFKFITPDGHVLRKRNFIYVPTRAGQQELTVFAEKFEKPIYKQNFYVNVKEEE